jgi:hypothetical protein
MSESGSPRSLIAPAAPFPRAATAQRPLAAASGPTISVPMVLYAVALVLSLMTTNPALTLACMLSLGLIVGLLWRPGEPPGLLLVCGMQWLQGALMTFRANATGVELWTLTYARSIDEATYLTLAWVSAVAIGAWLVTRKTRRETVAQTMALPIAFGRLIAVYLVWTVAVELLARLELRTAAQLTGALSNMRWLFLFAIFAYGWRQPRWRIAVLGVLVLEVATGFLSYFSAFKAPLILFAVALATSGYRPTLRAWAGLAMVFVLTLYLGVIWSAIKMDYRDRLSGGMSHERQTITLSIEERAESFIELVGTVDGNVLAKGAEQMVDRLAYVHYFAYVLDYVPAVRDHERGKLWGAAFSHVLMPRILFPDKAPLPDETLVTEAYTGLNLGSGRGTSISIGIVGESYIDFAEPGIVAFGLFFGLMLGLAYRYFITQRQYGVLAQGIAVALCMTYGTVENGAVKTLGSLLTFAIVYSLVWRLVMPSLTAWLIAPAAARQ